jgi:hypothetical protein
MTTRLEEWRAFRQKGLDGAPELYHVSLDLDRFGVEPCHLSAAIHSRQIWAAGMDEVTRHNYEEELGQYTDDLRYGTAGRSLGVNRLRERFAPKGIPSAVAFDPVGDSYVANDGDNQISKLDQQGILRIVVSYGGAPSSGDGVRRGPLAL